MRVKPENAVILNKIITMSIMTMPTTEPTAPENTQTPTNAYTQALFEQKSTWGKRLFAAKYRE